MSAEWSDVYEREQRELKLRETAGSLCWSDAHRDFASCYVCQKAYAALTAARAEGERVALGRVAGVLDAYSRDNAANREWVKASCAIADRLADEFGPRAWHGVHCRCCARLTAWPAKEGA